MKKCCPGFPIAFFIVFIVAVFIYYKYSFVAISKIDFSNSSFYQTKDEGIAIFQPENEQYTLCFFSSRQKDWQSFFKNKEKKIEILAIDLYQDVFLSGEDLTFLRIGSETMLKLINEFTLQKIPSCFLIKRNENNIMIYEKPKENGIYKLLNWKNNKE